MKFYKQYVVYLIIIIIIIFLLKNFLLRNTEILYYDGVDLEQNTKKILDNNNLSQYIKTATIYNTNNDIGNLLHLVTINNVNNINQATVQATLHTKDGTLIYLLYHETSMDLHRAKKGINIYNIKPIFTSGKYSNKNISIQISVANNDKETRKIIITY
jgi:hypothetical protein